MASEGGLGPDAAGAGAGGDGVVGGPRTPQQIASSKRLQQTQAQVDEVVDIMKTNVEKVLERDAKLSELDDRADALQQGASQFEQQAGKLKRKFWLQNLKMMIIMGVIGLIILAIIVGDLAARSMQQNTLRIFSATSGYPHKNTNHPPGGGSVHSVSPDYHAKFMPDSAPPAQQPPYAYMPPPQGMPQPGPAAGAPGPAGGAVAAPSGPQTAGAAFVGSLSGAHNIM